MKNPIINLFLLLLLIQGFALNTNAQQSPKPTLKPPLLQSFWGKTKGGELALEFVMGIIDSSVWVMDDKKVRYKISRFILVHRSKDKYEDEKTGELKSRFNVNSVTVRNAEILPPIWQKNLYESIKKEDEVIITDIYVRDKRGNLFAAPDVKIILK
jgi:hypothetical protein